MHSKSALTITSLFQLDIASIFNKVNEHEKVQKETKCQHFLSLISAQVVTKFAKKLLVSRVALRSHRRCLKRWSLPYKRHQDTFSSLHQSLQMHFLNMK